MQWEFVSMWHAMGPFAKGVVVILFTMFGASLVVMIDRFLRYQLARRHTRAFVAQAAGALSDGNLDQAISIAGRNKKSPIAQIVATGLRSFNPRMLPCPTRRSWTSRSAACSTLPPSFTPI
jgi:hypothetical protein